MKFLPEWAQGPPITVDTLNELIAPYVEPFHHGAGDVEDAIRFAMGGEPVHNRPFREWMTSTPREVPLAEQVENWRASGGRGIPRDEYTHSIDPDALAYNIARGATGGVAEAAGGFATDVMDAASVARLYANDDLSRSAALGILGLIALPTGVSALRALPDHMWKTPMRGSRDAQRGVWNYHGAQRELEGGRFDSGYLGTGEGTHHEGVGGYLTNNPTLAQEYAITFGNAPPGQTYAMDVDESVMGRLLDADAQISSQPADVRALVPDFDADAPLKTALRGNARLSRELDEAGYPGVRFVDQVDDDINTVLFNPERDIGDTRALTDAQLERLDREWSPDNTDPLGLSSMGRGQRGSVGVPQSADPWLDPVQEPWRTKITRPEDLPRQQGGSRPGQYIGAPDGIDTPDKFNGLAAEMADRIEYALDNGAYAGYFYDDAGRLMNELSGGNRATRDNIMGSSAIVSAGNRVSNERAMSGRSIEQWDMGYGRPGGPPIGIDSLAGNPKTGRAAGQYNRQNREMERLFAHTARGGRVHDVVKGPKIEEYGLAARGDTSALGANDRWEIGPIYGGGKETASTQQHTFMHSLRLRAAEIVEQRRGVRLRPKVAQELNWATSKAMGENKQVSDIVRQETWSGALPSQQTYQTWESAPGSRSTHLPGQTPKQAAKYHGDLTDLVIDPQTGRDRLLGALGTSQQMPAVHGPGVFEGQVSPGVTSVSIGANPYGKISPVTAARTRAQELVRGTVTGQDAVAGTMIGRTGPKNAMQLSKPLTPEAAKVITRRLDETFGAGNTAVINNPEGFAVINLGEQKGFPQAFNNYVMPDIESALGSDISLTRGTAGTNRSTGGGLLYEDLPWNESADSPVTHQMLEAIDDEMIPGMAGHADSPAMRQMAGELHSLYSSLKGQIPNEKIMVLLEGWRDGGLERVRDLASKGLVPAIALAAVSQMARPDDLQDDGLGYQ